MKTNTKRGIALLTGGVLAISAIVVPAAHAADSKKEKQLKTGAAILGALGAYFAVKGKTVPAVVAGAGAYYAYKKSKEKRDDYSYNDNDDDRYAQRSTKRDNDDIGYENEARYENTGDESVRDEEYSDDLGYDALVKTSDKTVEKSRQTKTVVVD